MDPGGATMDALMMMSDPTMCACCERDAEICEHVSQIVSELRRVSSMGAGGGPSMFLLLLM
jgi:hypothetical protein